MFKNPRRTSPTRAPALLSLLVILLLLLPFPSQARQVVAGSGPVIQGVVDDAPTGIPVAAASVSLFAADGTDVVTVFADENGRFFLEAPAPGAYRLRAEGVGYHPQGKVLPVVDLLMIDFQLSPAPIFRDSLLLSLGHTAQPMAVGEHLLYGRLLDYETGEPIPKGLILLMHGGGAASDTAISNQEGLFWLAGSGVGVHRLRAKRIGYKASTGPEIHLIPADTLGLDLYLSRGAVLSNPLVIRETSRPLRGRNDRTGMGGFLKRFTAFSRAGFGEFLKRDSIAKYDNLGISSGQMLGMATASVWKVDAQRDEVILRGMCNPVLYLDGFPLGGSLPWPYLPRTLVGVEIYLRPTIPPEFLRGFPCGVVAYWTRSGPDSLDDRGWWRIWLATAGIVTLALIIGSG